MIPLQNPFRTAALALGCLAAHATIAFAQPSVTATLSAGTAAVGEPVELRVEVAGAKDAAVPSEVPTADFDINHAGRSTQFELRNGQFSARTVHVYRVTPKREGNLTIPEILVETGGRTLKTPPLSLKVTAAPAGSAPGAGTQLRDLLFADLIVPKSTAYVGELIPAELRFFVLNDGRLRLRSEAGPSLQADGFTQKPMASAREVDQEINRQPFRVTVFQTHLTPAKAGALEVGPGEIPVTVQIQTPSAPGSNLDRFFDDEFFPNPLRQVQQQRVQIRSGTVKLDVKPLPTDGRPASFSGAVGTFEARIEASPRTGAVGDPITVKLTVSGRGDFDRVQAPNLGALPGWKTYPPTVKFTPDGDAQTGGSKEFEFVLVPEAAHRTTPELEFSFFDPKAERYVRIPLPPIALTLTGPVPALTPAPSAIRAETPAPTAATPTPAAPSGAAPQSGGLLDILSEPGGPLSADAAPLVETRLFLVINAVLAALLSSWAAAALIRRFRGNPEMRRTRELARTRDRALARLRKTTGADQLEPAIEALASAAALKHAGLPAAPEVGDVAGALSATDEDRLWLQALFRARERLRYAGGAGTPSLPPNLSDRVHALLRT
jgi:hypothetical protein